MKKSITFGQVGSITLVVCGERDPSDSEWSDWLAVYAAAALGQSTLTLLALSRGGAPKAHQRKQLQKYSLCEQLEERKVVVCSHARNVRAITTAFGWFFSMPHLKCFGYEERREALTFLNAPQAQWSETLMLLKRLEAEVGT